MAPAVVKRTDREPFASSIPMNLALEHDFAVMLELHARACLEALAGLDQAIPGLLIDGIRRICHLVEQQGLGRSARTLLMAKQASRQHARLVHDEQIARMQIVPDIAKNAMFEASIAVHDHEFAGITRNGRLLCYELFG